MQPAGRAWKRTADRQVPRTSRTACVYRRIILGVVLAAIILGLAIAGVACSEDPLAGAREAEEAGDYRKAAETYRQRLAEAPDDLEAIKGLAVGLYLMRDFDGALPFQERAIELDPKDVQIRVELGFNYLNHQREPAKAAEVLAGAAALEPSGKVLTFLAQAQIAAGRTTEAEVSLRGAISKEESYAHAYSLLIGLLEAQGRAEEAEEIRRAAQEAGVALSTEN